MQPKAPMMKVELTTYITWAPIRINIKIMVCKVTQASKVLHSMVAKETLIKMMFNLGVLTVPADGPALLGAGPSAGTVMTMFRLSIYVGPALEG